MIFHNLSYLTQSFTDFLHNGLTVRHLVIYHNKAANEIIEVPAFPVNVIDTTGSGDVFHGGYIYGLLQGWKLKETIRFASAVAAMKCTGIGGREGIPQLDEARQFLEKREIKLPGLKEKEHRG